MTDSRDELFIPDQPLGSLCPKVALARRLGLIDPAFARALHPLPRLRHAPAHSGDSASLSHPAHGSRLAAVYAEARANPHWAPLATVLADQPASAQNPPTGSGPPPDPPASPPPCHPGASRRLAVIPPQKQMTGMLGHPVAENPIDRMFDAVYAHHGLCWQFWKNDIANTADLALAVKALVPLGYRGMAITVPFKVAVLPLLDEVDDDVRAIGAANYLTIEAGRLIGHNNDGKGVVKAIEKLAPLAGRRVVMLGAGGAGRAMAVEMAWAGASHLTLITRRQEQGQEVADTVTRASGVPAVWQAWEGEVSVPAGTTLLMNATHLGCAPELEPVPVRWDSVDPVCVVVDVITNPRITPFLATARRHGCPVVDGVEMLVQLAMQIFEQWTGITPEEAVFQRAVAEALGE